MNSSKRPSKAKLRNQPSRRTKAKQVPSPTQSKPELVPLPSRDDSPRVTKEDLESDCTLWDLYKRWCLYFDYLHRTPEEMEQRFGNFKSQAILAFELNNKPNATCFYGITQYADLTDEEATKFFDGGLVDDDDEEFKG